MKRPRMAVLDSTRTSVRATVLAAVLLLPFPVAARAVRFSAEVRHGESIRRPLAKGLWFCLTPTADTGRNSGWMIRIQRLCKDESPDYAGIATPPYHGPNPVQIVAWFFDEGANTPHDVHDFQFVLNVAGYARVAQALDRRSEALGALLEKLARGRGHLVITDRRMNPRDGSIDWIRFAVRLEWPD